METGKIIKVLVVDDSNLMCKVLTDVLNSDPGIIVLGVANNGKEAVELTRKIKPDIITMDVHMPVMDGIEATENIMAYNPTPILLITSSTPKPGEGSVFDAINNGALDFLEKKGIEYYSNKINRIQIIEKVKYLSRVKVITHPKGKKINKAFETRRKDHSLDSEREKIIAVSSSTGGTEALSRILETLPGDLSCPMLIVQHMTSGFDNDFACWLNSKSQLEVKIGEHSEKLIAGKVYLAPTDYQLRIDKERKIILSKEPSYNGHCPSGDILLQSAAGVYGKNAIGLILTGMGKDGAAGIKSIHDAGGKTIAQDESTCVIFGMPKAAIELGAVDYILPLNKIAEKLIEIV